MRPRHRRPRSRRLLLLPLLAALVALPLTLDALASPGQDEVRTHVVGQGAANDTTTSQAALPPSGDPTRPSQGSTESESAAARARATASRDGSTAGADARPTGSMSPPGRSSGSPTTASPDSSASGPASTSPQAAACSSTNPPPPLATWPSAENTGVPPGTPLTVVEGDLRTSQDGQVITGLDIRGDLYVAHDDVVVSCSRVRGITTNSARRLRMWQSSLGDPHGAREGSAVKFSDYMLRRVDIQGTFDGLKAHGNVDVQDSYIHDLYRTSDPSTPNGMTHNDGVQINPGSHMVFRHNTFHMWSFTDGQSAGALPLTSSFGDGAGYTTSAFMIADDTATVSDVLIENNMIRGRTSKYVIITGRVDDVRLVGNHIGRENRDYPRVFGLDPVGTLTVSGNVFFDDGTPATR